MTNTQNEPLEEALRSYWGERCPDYNAQCSTCMAWMRYDALTRPSSVVDPKPNAGLVEEVREDLIRAPYEWHGPFGKEKHRIIPPSLFDRILSALGGDRP